MLERYDEIEDIHCPICMEKFLIG